MGEWFWLIIAVVLIAFAVLWFNLAMKKRDTANRDQARGQAEVRAEADARAEVDDRRRAAERAAETPVAADTAEVEEAADPQREVTEAEGAADAPEEPELNYAYEGVAGAERFGPAVLAAGAHVTFEGQTYLVAGTGALREGDRIWYEHLLQGGTTPQWISVENVDNRIKLGWWENREDIAVEYGEEMEAAGERYHLWEEGEADFAVSGLTQQVTQGILSFRSLSTEDGKQLLRFETWGEGAKTAASLGRYIGWDELTVQGI